MAELQDAVLLLRRIPYGDSSLICHFLTAHHGRIALMAKAARRPKSPFRAELAPLYALTIGWRTGRTGMGTLTEARRAEPLLPEAQMLDGLELLAVAARLFPEGDLHGYPETRAALAHMDGQAANAALPLAVWHLFEQSGWLGDLASCWQCGAEADGEMRWQQAQLLCDGCAGHGGMAVHAGLRKSIEVLLAGGQARMSAQDAGLWRRMLRLAMAEHGIRPTDGFA